MTMKKICANPECRKEFESNYKNKRFCCKECGKKYFIKNIKSIGILSLKEKKKQSKKGQKRKIKLRGKNVEMTLIV